MIDLTVVIPSYETRSLLLSCLASVEAARRARPQVSVETIVVDNGSRDGSVEAVFAKHPDVRVFALVRNRGFAAAVNIALRARGGRTALLLNSDVEIDLDLLADGCQILGENPDVWVVGAALRHPDGRSQRSVHPLPGLQTELLPEFVLRWMRPAGFVLPAGSGPDLDANRRRRVEAVRGAVFFVRGDALEELGMLDERFFFFLEETEYCARVRRAGKYVMHAEDLGAIHRLGASSKRRVPLVTRIEFHRSLYRYLDLESGPGVARLAFCLRLLRGGLLTLVLTLTFGFSTDARRRFSERWGLLLWHLRGCPEEPRLADALEADRAASGRP